MSDITYTINENLINDNYEFVLMLLDNYELSQDEKKSLNSIVQRIGANKNIWSTQYADTYRKILSKILKKEEKKENKFLDSINSNNNNIVDNNIDYTTIQTLPTNLPNNNHQQLLLDNSNNNQKNKIDNNNINMIITFSIIALITGAILLKTLGTTSFVMLVAFVSVIYNIILSSKK